MSGQIDRKPCSKCFRTGGIVVCGECEQRFCFEHLFVHRKSIEEDFQRILDEEKQMEKEFEDDVDRQLEEHFSDIDRWKKDSIEEIKQIAKKAKTQLRTLKKESNKHLADLTKQLGDELQLMKQNENLSEIQLKKLDENLKLLKEKSIEFELIKSKSTNYLHVKIENRWENEVESSLNAPFPPVRSSRNERIETKFDENSLETNHLNRFGSIRIKEIDRFGHFISIEHDGSTNDRDEDLVGWTLKRTIDSSDELIYRFPNEFRLKCRSEMKILSENASNVLFATEKSSCLIANGIRSWGTTIQSDSTILFDANGNERDRVEQRNSFSSKKTNETK